MNYVLIGQLQVENTTFIFHPKNWWTAGQQNVGIFSHSFLLFFFNFKTLFDGLLQKKINKSKNIL